MKLLGKTTNADRAKKHLFAAQQTYYAEPLTIVDGEGSRLRDDQGNEYLDGFAGICTNTLGYGDTEVAQAVADQARKLIHISTLYLNEPMLDLAEKIAEIAPDGMTKSFFSNSGTEANETAALCARTFKGSSDFIALEHAYHGRSLFTVALAGQSQWRNFGPQMPHVAFAPTPYCYRCPLNLQYPTCEIACAKAAKNVIETQTNGAPAAMIAETISGVGGIVTPPDEYFKVLKETLAPYGTLLIADEVQAGWGRLGDGFFGMPSSYGVVPDMITSAKGLGSGLPIGITITRPELADAFKGPHINTFGGNPVSTRGAKVTIEQIEKRDLIANCKKQGNAMLDGLREMQKRFPIVGEVRGKGLMIGVELVKDRQTKEVAPDAATKMLEEMRKRKVLIGKGGKWGNVLRIQPPFIFDASDVREFLKAAEESFAAL
ncbi:MAG TPA: aspartate aminotransferase family protein [Verrucomicrobiae bacterium]|jgi:4-aminobutyrate aminotransferase|nr:aspartate aminotransferase family protein [Verrucomicrobiae bacterium]